MLPDPSRLTQLGPFHTPSYTQGFPVVSSRLSRLTGWCFSISVEVGVCWFLGESEKVGGVGKLIAGARRTSNQAAKLALLNASMVMYTGHISTEG